MRRGLIALGVALAGCSVHGLALTGNDALSLTFPTDGGHVRMPLTVEMHVADAGLAHRLAQGEVRLAVFFDRSPMRSGETFRAVADKECRQTPGCPDAAYLTQRDVFETSSSSLTVPQLPDTRTTRKRVDEHDVTVVLVDPAGRRQGDTAYHAEFEIDRPGPPQ